jgi:serine/threonine-protein kinase
MPEALIEERARGRIGTTLNGKYRIDRLLGIGGMAAVYAATHRNNKRVAVKVLHPELSVHSGLRTRFMREGYVANTLDHPGAVAVLDDDVAEDGAAFLVMELLDGETFAEACDRLGGKLALRAVLAMAHQVLDVLVAAEAKSVVHRDLKPSNLFLLRTGHVKVLDFGVARMREVGRETSTLTGLALGTPAFMAPEQALGRSEEIDSLTDMWALGATMFALATGGPVHEASTPQEQMVFAATRKAPSFASTDPSVPAAVAEIVDRALAFQRSARWPGPRAMREAVGEVYRSQYKDEPSPAALVFMASPEKVAVASSSSPPSPMASTVPTTPVSPEVRPVAELRATPSGTSLSPTSSHPASAKAGRARFLAGASLVGLGAAAAAAFGFWAMARGGTEPRAAANPSATAATPVAAARVAEAGIESPAPNPAPSSSAGASAGAGAGAGESVSAGSVEAGQAASQPVVAAGRAKGSKLSPPPASVSAPSGSTAPSASVPATVDRFDHQ